ncbi:MAG: response regulator transcription factor [SAR202 cluster bacterium]|nr:response regulator transcription factor [SAR202 cluster bacterium]
MASTVLIVEDDPHTAKIVELYLNRDGHKVIATGDGTRGLDLARQINPDLIVLDVMLPNMNGIEICRILRLESDVAIVMLTARVEENDRLAGLDIGADDYVTKPFSPKELAARIRAVLRRTKNDALRNGPDELKYENITINISDHSVEINGDSIQLTPTEFRLLVMFLKNPARVLSREQIISEVFGYDFDGYDRTVDVHVSNLRRKLELHGTLDNILQTAYGVGYKFGHA